MEVRALTWNLFHGRDRAPERGLHTWRSRLLRVTERGETHAQLNRDLFDEFATVLCGATWDLALLQECPPRWAEALATACEAEPHLVLTARNLPAALTGLQRLGGRLNPDLLASWEGGSNLTLVRGRRRGETIIERRELTLTRRPETRRMAFTRLAPRVSVANLHASEQRRSAEREVAEAARVACEWAGEEPLIFGGDLNLNRASSAPLFTALAEEHGLSEPTPGRYIDHVLVRGLTTIAPPRAWPPEKREVPEPGPPAGKPPLAVRLSDHAPVEARFELDEVPG